jgi:hypothetical protein
VITEVARAAVSTSAASAPNARSRPDGSGGISLAGRIVTAQDPSATACSTTPFSGSSTCS